jgi:methionine-rich copper-binding protein CopC
MNMKTITGMKIAALLGLLLTFPVTVLAHAQPDHSVPKVGSKLNSAPTEVRIWFDDDIQAASSEIQVLDEKGNRVDKKDSHGNAKDKTLLTVSLIKIEPGIYTVLWHALCLEGHTTSGEFKFTVTPRATTRPGQ